MNCMSLFSCATDKSKNFNNLSVILFFFSTSNAIKRLWPFNCLIHVSASCFILKELGVVGGVKWQRLTIINQPPWLTLDSKNLYFYTAYVRLIRCILKILITNNKVKTFIKLMTFFFPKLFLHTCIIQTDGFTWLDLFSENWKVEHVFHSSIAVRPSPSFSQQMFHSLNFLI